MSPMTVWQGQDGHAQSIPEPEQTTEFKLFPEQQAAKDAFLAWFEKQPQRDVDEDEEDRYDQSFEESFGLEGAGIFRIFGYAGTGKTTIVKSIVESIKGTKLFGAYTGKAALVMQRAGLPAQTIHSLIYKPVVPDKKRAQEQIGRAHV